MEVLEGIHLISLGGSAEAVGGPTVSAYYVRGEDCGAFIDAGSRTSTGLSLSWTTGVVCYARKSSVRF